MNIPAHDNNTKPFDKLTASGRASSIAAMINNIRRAIEHHIKKSPHPAELRNKYGKRLRDLADTINP